MDGAKHITDTLAALLRAFG